MVADLIGDLKKKKPVLGLERTIKKIRGKQISRIYVAINSHAKEQMTHLGKVMNVEVIFVQENSKELGVLCKKPFSVSVLSFE